MWQQFDRPHHSRVPADLGRELREVRPVQGVRPEHDHADHPIGLRAASGERGDGVQDDEGAGIAGATDAQVDACVQGFAAFACTDLCNQIPMDPPACGVIDSSPNTGTYTCAP